jgi:hypothetical protein
MTRKETARRLRKLARVLKKVRDHQFNMFGWWWGEPKPNCGTAACALGHACTVPEFYRLGLRLDDNVPIMPGRHSGFDSGAALFGISYGEARYLFAPSRYMFPSKHNAIARIEALAAQYS